MLKVLRGRVMERRRQSLCPGLDAKVGPEETRGWTAGRDRENGGHSRERLCPETPREGNTRHTGAQSPARLPRLVPV